MKLAFQRHTLSTGCLAYSERIRSHDYGGMGTYDGFNTGKRIVT